MKTLFLSFALIFAASVIVAQSYPQPEFSNEIYFLKKDSALLLRLEKGSSSMDTKMKMGGYGGSESGYEMSGDRSTTRLSGGSNLSFIYYTGSSSYPNAKRDSMMRANGVDPDMMQSMSEPSNMITLYRAEPTKDKRKIFLMKTGGMVNPFGSHKNKSSDKYTFSTRKVKDGYWELVVDKPLPKGEYIFTMMGGGMGNMDGSMLLFAFAVD